MLMTRPTIADREAVLVAILSQSDAPAWMGRPEIAAAMGKVRLNPFDVAALKSLLKQGRVLEEKHDIPGPISERWEYKLK